MRFDVIVNRFLPVEQIALASDIKTRKEVRVTTGKMIHCFQVEDKLMVSQELYDEIKNGFDIQEINNYLTDSI